jgi:hypothetical protein
MVFHEIGAKAMTHIHYQIVPHAEGWAYKLGDVFSETFSSHELALKAAREAAARQAVGGTTQAISYEDKNGQWHEEIAPGGDRPEVDIVDVPN